MTVQPQDRKLIVGALIGMVGGVIAIVGAALPWVVGSNGAVTQIGLEYQGSQLPIQDGLTNVILAVLSIVATLVWLRRDSLPERLSGGFGRSLGSGASLSALTGLVIASISLLLLRDIDKVVTAANSLVPDSASIGAGIFVEIAAGVVMIAGGGLRLMSSREL